MIALEVLVNGQPYRTMGFSDFGMVTAGVNWLRIEKKTGPIHEDLHVAGSGVDRVGGEYLTWDPQALKLGDEVTIRIVDLDKIDPPDRTEASSLS